MRVLKWLFLLNNKGEVENTGEKDPIEEALQDQLPEEEKPEEDPKPDEGEKTEEEKQAEVAAAEEKAAKDKADAENLIDVEGYKGVNRRAKRFDGDERRKDVLDKRNNLDLDFDYGHGDKASKKISFDEIKSALKFMQDNSQTIAAGLSMNKYGKQFPEFGTMMNKIITGSFNDKDEFNGDFTKKIIAAIEAKEEVIEEKADEVDTEMAKIQKILDDGEIDPDSPQADVLKSSLLSLKAMKGQLGVALTKLDGVTKEFGDVKAGQKAAVERNTTEDHRKEVKRIAGLFDGEMQDLTDKEKKEGYKFVVESEAAEFDSAVRAGVQKSVADLKLKEGESFSDEQFVKLVRENAKAAYAALEKKREAIEQAYIKRKGLLPKKPANEEEPPEAKGDMNIGDLTESVEKMLTTPE